MGLEGIIYIFLMAIGAGLFYLYSKTGKLLRCILFSATTGVTALGVVWLLGRMMDFTVEWTPFTVAVSALLGIPGVVSMLILRLI